MDSESDDDIFIESVVPKSTTRTPSPSCVMTADHQDSKTTSIKKNLGSSKSSSNHNSTGKSTSDNLRKSNSSHKTSSTSSKSQASNPSKSNSSSSKPSTSTSLKSKGSVSSDKPGKSHDPKCSSVNATTSQNVDKNESLVVEISQIESELKSIESQIQSLRRRKNTLQDRKTQLQDELMMLKSEKLSHRDWSTIDFEWSARLQELLNNVFKIIQFRHLQLSAINATLSKQDLILVMPTGGGKSLCYQLPALISSGLTLVVSPLISLMEDQVMQLRKLGIPAEMMTATTTREENSRIRKLILSGGEHEKPKLLYAAPEKLAKNKSFMSFLQSLHRANGLARIAIDEVHCCSDWGHDFRPDYIFLGVLRDMFSEVPIIGLTATASNKVITDVQKILSLEGSLILKAPFNRPNLYYEVRPKTSVQSEWLDEVEKLLKNDFKDQTGIIYAFSIKDTEEVTTELRNRKIKARCYHANLPPEYRSQSHTQWLSGQVQVIVATTAFGLGIDKPDVRFVIHHSISKSIENYYQESGRAGRDGKKAKCILYYRFADYFRLSTLVFTQQTGLPKLSHMLGYCIEPTKCRRALVAEHFSDNWDNNECNSMCDHCKKPRTSEEKDVTELCINAYKLIQNALVNETRLTSNMLFDLWYGKGKAALRLKDVPTPRSSRTHMENVVAHFIKSNFIKEDFNYTAYSTTSYLKIDPQGRAMLDAGYRIKMSVAGGFKRDISPSVESKVAVKKIKT